MLKKARNLGGSLLARAATVAALATALSLTAVAAASAQTNSVSSAFSGTGNGVLTDVLSILPDVLIPFVAYLAIRGGIALYHKVRP